MTRLAVPDIARLLNVSRPRVWQLRKRPDFPEPAGSEGGRDYWTEDAIWRWAAGAGRALAERAPVLYRPAGEEPPGYLGARIIDGYAVFPWQTAHGVVCLGYSRAHRDRPDPSDLLALADADVAVSVRLHWSPWGPELDAVDAQAPERVYEPLWKDLERITGGPAPWWPSSLRRPEEMIRWEPGAEPLVTPPVTDPDTTPLLRVAFGAEEGSPIRVTLSHLAHTVEAGAAESAHDELELLTSCADRESIALAARPAPLRPEGDEPSELVRRAAWIEIIGRRDARAEQCVDWVGQWDGGADLPFWRYHALDTTDDVVAEWAATLQPTERTAAFAVFSDDDIADPLTDPATGLPVARNHDGIYRAAVPQRLPAHSELAEVILAHRVWIRTADGTLYLAPEGPGAGISYGYRGTGPSNLAILIERLLDDITAPAARASWGRQERAGLLAGFAGKWKRGDILTRTQLLAAAAPGAA